MEAGSAKWVGRDRLGSVRAVYENGVVTRMSYFPYGQERGTRTAEDTWKFATYWRDADGVLDDAQQRWYASGWGRFTTADPYQGSGGVGEPGSWNRYGYVGGDPVNFGDPRGTNRFAPELGGHYPDDSNCGAEWLSDASLWGPCGGGGGDGGWDDGGALACGVSGDPFAPVPIPCPAPVPPSIPPPEEQEPECFAQLKYRAVDDPRARVIGATHSFWYVQDSTGQQHILHGGPEPPTGPNRKLNVWDDDWPSAKELSDTPGSGTHWSSGLSSVFCDKVDGMVAAADAFPNDKIGYQDGGPNSNSVAAYLARFAGFRVTAPPGAYGWSVRIPGLP